MDGRRESRRKFIVRSATGVTALALPDLLHADEKFGVLDLRCSIR